MRYRVFGVDTPEDGGRTYYCCNSDGTDFHVSPDRAFICESWDIAQSIISEELFHMEKGSQDGGRWWARLGIEILGSDPLETN